MAKETQTSKNMTTCQACGKEIAKSAKTCPSCGAKQKSPIYKKWWFWVIIVIFIAIIIPKGNSPEKEDIQVQPSKKEENLKGSKEKPYNKDEVITVGDVEWKIVSAENIGSVIKSGNQFIEDCKTDSGSYVKLIVSVKNNRKEMFSIMNLNIFDDQDRKYITSSDVSMCVKDTLFILDNINPGIEKSYTAIYEIPADAKNLKLELDSTGSLFSGEKNKYISLGF